MYSNKKKFISSLILQYHLLMKHLALNNIALLKQLSDILIQLKEEEYQQPLEVYSGSSLGQHTRHILSFFHCIVNGVTSDEVCYDARNRNQLIEISPKAAIEDIENITSNLKNINSDKQVVFSSTIDGHKDSIPSSLSRELLYVIEHTVHHMAIIKMGAMIN